MKFVVETHTNFQGSVYFKPSFFNHFDLRQDTGIDFRIGLQDLMVSIEVLAYRNPITENSEIHICTHVSGCCE